MEPGVWKFSFDRFDITCRYRPRKDAKRKISEVGFSENLNQWVARFTIIRRDLVMPVDHQPNFFGPRPATNPLQIELCLHHRWRKIV